jgi:hypothetical protein
MAPGVIFRTNDGNESLKAIMSQEPLEVADSLIEIVGERPELDASQIRIDYIDDLLPQTVRNIGDYALCRQLGINWRQVKAEEQDENF